jgi:hypothetical protein
MSAQPLMENRCWYHVGVGIVIHPDMGIMKVHNSMTCKSHLTNKENVSYKLHVYNAFYERPWQNTTLDWWSGLRACTCWIWSAKCCRNINKSGGVCIYVHESVSFTTIDLDSYCKEHEFEVCAVKLCIMSVTYCIIAIYRSPTGKVPYFISALDSVLRTHK